jgi:hypothetical protein
VILAGAGAGITYGMYWAIEAWGSRSPLGLIALLVSSGCAHRHAPDVVPHLLG